MAFRDSFHEGVPTLRPERRPATRELPAMRRGSDWPPAK